VEDGYSAGFSRSVLRSQVTVRRREHRRRQVALALQRLCLDGSFGRVNKLDQNLYGLGYDSSQVGLETYLQDSFGVGFRFVAAGSGWQLWPCPGNHYFPPCLQLPKALNAWLDWLPIRDQLEVA
jgi:hypothetical protein